MSDSPSLPPLLSLTPTELGQALGSPVRARRVWAALREGRAPCQDTLLGPRPYALLQRAVCLEELPVLTRSVSSCGTTKLLLGLRDGHKVEAVIIPGDSRSTLCLSSQVGCVRGCTFCMTATMGILRNLRMEEVVGQVTAAARESRERGLPPLRNVVFMGMGEPLDNASVTWRAVETLLDRDGFRLAAKHVTVSTVGTTPKKILALGALKARLAWSVHAVDDTLRRQLVPTTKHTMIALRDAFLKVMDAKREPLMIEMTLIRGVNDGEREARRLVEFLRPFVHGVRVNLIPMNPGRQGLAPTTEEGLERFAAIVREAGLYCCLRRERGQESSAACGQLAVTHESPGKHGRGRGEQAR